MGAIPINRNSELPQGGFNITVSNLRTITKPESKTRAFCDATLRLPGGVGELKICGFSVVENGKGPWVGFPQRKGEHAWFPVVEANGKIRELISNAVLDAYADAGK